MTRSQRRIHALIWTVGGPILIVALIAVLAARPPVTSPELPAAEGSP